MCAKGCAYISKDVWMCERMCAPVLLSKIWKHNPFQCSNMAWVWCYLVAIVLIWNPFHALMYPCLEHVFPPACNDILSDSGVCVCVCVVLCCILRNLVRIRMLPCMWSLWAHTWYLAIGTSVILQEWIRVIIYLALKTCTFWPFKHPKISQACHRCNVYIVWLLSGLRDQFLTVCCEV